MQGNLIGELVVSVFITVIQNVQRALFSDFAKARSEQSSEFTSRKRTPFSIDICSLPQIRDISLPLLRQQIERLVSPPSSRVGDIVEIPLEGG